MTKQTLFDNEPSLVAQAIGRPSRESSRRGLGFHGTEPRPFRILSFLLIAGSFCLNNSGLAADQQPKYQGTPYHDKDYSGGPQAIPGRVKCAYYDLGGEGIAYHDSDAKNNGSGALNPANGTYLNEFRMQEGVDTSYTKFKNQVDNSPYDSVQPEENQLYVGWTEPGEWFNLTVDVKKPGTYVVGLMYTSNRGGSISFDLNGKDVTGPVAIKSTFNSDEPIAWRQWHHWNKLNIAEIRLPKGIHVLTLHVVDKGNMNFDYLEFTPVYKR